MFTGIIEAVGQVEKVTTVGEVTKLVIHSHEIEEGVDIGDSIAINGTCLTVTTLGSGYFTFDAIRETLDRTNIGKLAVGSKVNLERAMRSGDRFDGHMVQGHVDGVGAVDAIQQSGEDVELHIKCAPDLADLLVDKGSVTVDGVSLTVAGVRPDGFHVALIPHTMKVTTLGLRGVGDPVNLEADILGKYVKQYVGRILGQNRPGAAAS